MKRIGIIAVITLCALNSNAISQTRDAQQLILNYQKLQQLKEILDNMKRGYKILDQGYTTIKNLSEGNFTLHQIFLDGLLLVNPTVRNYKRIPMIINYQKMLVEEYNRAYSRFRNDKNFTADEIAYLSHVYANLFDASLKNLDDLVMIITESKLRMNDDERMAAIDRIYFDMENKLVFLRAFNNSTNILAIQRAKAAHDIESLKKLHDVK